MIRQLHPHTKPQRATAPENVPEHARRLGYEPSDIPPGKIAKGIAALFLFLGLSLTAAAVLLPSLTPRHSSLSASQAKSRFRSPAPPLETGDGVRPSDLNAIQASKLDRPGPGQIPIDAAMAAVAAQGWSETAPAPSRAETARRRAETRR